MNDNRLVCSEEKRKKISETKAKTLERRTNQVIKSFECKIKSNRLSKRQKEQLKKLFVEAKWFYNHILNIRNNEHIDFRQINTKNVQTVVHYDKDKNEIKSKLDVLSSQHKQQIVQNMIANTKAIVSLVKRGYQTHGSLKFKSEINAIPLKQYGITYRLKSAHKLKVQGISKDLFIRGTDQFLKYDCEYANAVLLRKSDGYYLKITCCINKDKLSKIQSNGKEIGIDFGCETNLIFSDGRKLNCQIEESDRLKRLQTKLNRHQTKRSNNRDKTINKIQREYQKMTNKKKEFANQLIHKLKSYDLIVIQDEQFQNWQKSKHGKKIQDSCMGLIKSKLRQLENCIMLDKFIPTTKFCTKCGKQHDEMKLSDRQFECCGESMDRDVHAAQNMLNIFHLVDDYFSEHKLLPSERRKVKLAEFKTTISGLFDSETSYKTLKQEDATL